MISWRLWLGGAGVAFLLNALPCAASGSPVGTPPGTRVTNQAAVSYVVDGETRRGVSNSVTLVVAQRLDVGMGGGRATVTSVATPVPVTVTNMGTGAEAYRLDATITPGLAVEMIALDANGDGRFDAEVDQPLDGATPVLAPGQTAALVAMVRPSAEPVDGALTIAAAARTGSGTVDAVFAGQGDDGGDAVVGLTGAAASVRLPLVAAAGAPRLVKSQSVRAPDGSAQARSGAVVTYTLIAGFPRGEAHATRINDPIPAGTRYLPGTLALDGVAMTDAEDADPGACDGRLVSVALGDIASDGAATHTVTFAVQLP